ncbi:hypothetical protein ACFQVA_29345 [Actinomadura keratinilytica]
MALAEGGGHVDIVHEPEPGGPPAVVPGEVAVALPETPPRPGEGWAAPDLALIRLQKPADHACVHLAEQPLTDHGRQAGGRSGLLLGFAGWFRSGHRLSRYDGTVTVLGRIGWGADEELRLGDDDLPDGVSGGPVFDPHRGEVVALVKSRRTREKGGTAVRTGQLRHLPVAAAPPPTAAPAPAGSGAHTRAYGPGDHAPGHPAGADWPPPEPAPGDLYQEVLRGHDRFHRDRLRHADRDGAPPPGPTPRPSWTAPGPSPSAPASGPCSSAPSANSRRRPPPPASPRCSAPSPAAPPPPAPSRRPAPGATGSAGSTRATPPTRAAASPSCGTWSPCCTPRAPTTTPAPPRPRPPCAPGCTGPPPPSTGRCAARSPPNCAATPPPPRPRRPRTPPGAPATASCSN